MTRQVIWLHSVGQQYDVDIIGAQPAVIRPGYRVVINIMFDGDFIYTPLNGQRFLRWPVLASADKMHVWFEFLIK